jgi:sec-independent protein translocase protein TatC
MAFLRDRFREKRQNSSGDPDEFRLTFVEHLEELRDRLIRSIFILVVAWVAGWFLVPIIYANMNGFIDKAVRAGLPDNVEYREVFSNATQPFMLKFRLSFMLGLAMAFPFLVLQLWGFIAPALKPSEQKPFRALAPLSFLLFAMGAGFCWIILPAAMAFFASFVGEFQGVQLYQEAGQMIFFCLKMMMAFGVAFQLPLVVYALGALGLLSHQTLFKYWRQATTVIFILSAVLTPSQDAFSMLMMAVPMVVLFLISAFVVRATQRRKEAAREEPVPEYSLE